MHQILDNYYSDLPDGIPGNDDTGTMSAWAVFSMMGFYPDCPGEPCYTLTEPSFKRLSLKDIWRISHESLIGCSELVFY